MCPLRDVDVVARGFASTVTTRLTVGDHLAQIACGGGLGDAGHRHVLISIEPTEEAAISVGEQALQGLGLGLLQRSTNARYPAPAL